MTYKNTLLIFLSITLLLILSFLFKSYFIKSEQLQSQIVMQRAMQIVKEQKPTPVQSSYFYATISKMYVDEIDKQAKYSIDKFAISSLEEVLKGIVIKDNKNSEGFRLKQSIENWNLTKEWNAKDQIPFSPKGDNLNRFILDNKFIYKVPPPPVYGGDKFITALKEVKDAAAVRTLEEGAMVNFWGGVPGSEAPAGIWQGRLAFYAKKYNLSDKEYAYAQNILAQTLADAFMECWKVKFDFQTKRPNMTDITINLAMPNPPFPSYVSGHSTISFAGATVLSVMFPSDRESILQDAYNAKNSRLHAGIHFSYDNDEGEKLGKAIGDFVIEKSKVEKIR